MTIEVSIVESALRDLAHGMPYALAIWITLVTAWPAERARAGPPPGGGSGRGPPPGGSRRGGLSRAALNDSLARRNGWDPHRHPADHEVALRRIACRRRWAAYQAVAEIERSTRHRADVAAAAELSLLDEAYAAPMRAQRAGATHEGSEKLERARPLRLRLAYP